MRILLPSIAFSATFLSHHSAVNAFSTLHVSGVSQSLAASRLRAVSVAAATALDELSTMTTLSIDSADLDVVEKFAKAGLITDATTNPLFVSQAGASGDKRYEDMVFDAIMYAKEKRGGGDSPLPDFEPELNIAMDKLAVNLGAKLLSFVPGKVSTEVDVRLSYDTQGTIERAKSIIDMYAEMGVDKSRVLIKIAGTWEGIQAAKELEKLGIQTNITLIFSFLQAAAAAQAGCYLISPFPGRILDWHKAKGGKQSYHPTADPGVLSVKRMYGYFRKYGYKTICMPASWRPSRGAAVAGSDVDEILALAGVDEMTIPPALLESLMSRGAGDIVRECDPKADAAVCCEPDFKLDEDTYKAYWDTDACGKDKLEEGIQAFTKSVDELREVLISKFG